MWTALEAKLTNTQMYPLDITHFFVDCILLILVQKNPLRECKKTFIVSLFCLPVNRLGLVDMSMVLYENKRRIYVQFFWRYFDHLSASIFLLQKPTMLVVPREAIVRVRIEKLTS